MPHSHPIPGGRYTFNQMHTELSGQGKGLAPRLDWLLTACRGVRQEAMDLRAEKRFLRAVNPRLLLPARSGIRRTGFSGRRHATLQEPREQPPRAPMFEIPSAGSRLRRPTRPAAPN